MSLPGGLFLEEAEAPYCWQSSCGGSCAAGTLHWAGGAARQPAAAARRRRPCQLSWPKRCSIGGCRRMGACTPGAPCAQRGQQDNGQHPTCVSPGCPLSAPAATRHLQGLEAYTRLEKLSLASLGLKSLAGLPTQLTYLAVNDNNLTGAALSDLASLTRLRRLDLAGKPAAAGCWWPALHAGRRQGQRWLTAPCAQQWAARAALQRRRLRGWLASHTAAGGVGSPGCESLRHGGEALLWEGGIKMHKVIGRASGWWRERRWRERRAHSRLATKPTVLPPPGWPRNAVDACCVPGGQWGRPPPKTLCTRSVPPGAFRTRIFSGCDTPRSPATSTPLQATASRPLASWNP